MTTFNINIEFSKSLLKGVRQEMTAEQSRRLRKVCCTRVGRDEFHVQSDVRHDGGYRMSSYIQACNAYEAKAKAILRWKDRYYPD